MNNQSEHILSIDQVLEQDFDVVIVGGGMGGATSAYALSKKGYRVLLIEKGAADLLNENQLDIDVEIEDPGDRVKYHYWPTKITSVVDNSESANFTPTGCGVGGSTRLYAGTLERLEPVDFLPQSLPDGSTVDWPYDYKDLEPYYQKVEELFNVHGSTDPLKGSQNHNLKSPKELNATDKQFYNIFKNSGLHPYRLHIALSKELGVSKQQYMGALEACVLPALTTGNLKVIENCEVIHIDATADLVTGLVVSHQNKSYSIPAQKVILAAGAFFTPVMLLRSISQDWPTGLANHNDLVGRNLMFHVSDFIGIWGKEKHPDVKPSKSIGFSDFYSYDGAKYGQFQSVGMSIEYGYILYFLRTRFQSTFWAKIPILNKIIRQLLRGPAFIATHLFKDASVFSSVIEDFPYQANRVVYDESKPSDLYFIYNVPEELKSRVKKFRRFIKKKVNSKLVVFFNKGIVLNYGHPCGTCKAGTNPEQSVVDSHCKVHGIKNLYVADASFMPTSGGTNPSLTIAANALRVVDGITIARDTK